MAKRRKARKRKRKKAKKISTKMVVGIIGIIIVIAVGLFLWRPVPPTPEFIEPSAGEMSLAYDDGSPVSPERVLLDDNIVSIIEGKIDISGLTEGSHKLIIIVSGLEYEEDFYYEGEGVTITVAKPIETHIAVFSKEVGQPISNINVYLEGENKCTTGTDGTCSFFAKPDRYTIRLQGEGIFYEEIKSISRTSYSFTFKVSRTLFADIKVKDELTGNPIENAEVYLDGGFKGRTDSLGSFKITDVSEGSHNLEVKYKTVSKPQTISISLTQTSFEVKIKAPKTITLELKDSETQKPIDFMKIFLEGSTVTYRSYLETDDVGKTIVEDVLPGDYQIRIEGVPTIVKPSKLITIRTETFISESLDMPNPRFAGSLSCRELGILDRYGVCDITVRNRDYERSITTQDTSVVLLVYLVDGETVQLVDKDLLEFNKISSGGSDTQTSHNLYGFQFFKQEIVVAVILEGWKYTPESETNIGEISMPPSVAERWLKDLGDALVEYCQTNPAECLKIIAGAFAHVVG